MRDIGTGAPFEEDWVGVDSGVEVLTGVAHVVNLNLTLFRSGIHANSWMMVRFAGYGEMRIHWMSVITIWSDQLYPPPSSFCVARYSKSGRSSKSGAVAHLFLLNSGTTVITPFWVRVFPQDWYSSSTRGRRDGSNCHISRHWLPRFERTRVPASRTSQVIGSLRTEVNEYSITPRSPKNAFCPLQSSYRM